MTSKLKKYSIVIITAMLLTAMAFAGVASAAATPINTAEELKDGLNTMALDTVLDKNLPTGSLFVNISNTNNNRVTLMLGKINSTTINTTTLPAGVTNITISNIDDGPYNLFGYYMTGPVSTGVIKMAMLSDGAGYIDLVFPQQNITSGIYTDTESDEEELNIAVDGLDTILGAEPAPAAGKQINFNFVALSKSYNASNTNQTKLRTAILANTANPEITYLSLFITNSTINIPTNSIESVEYIVDTANLMTIYIEYDMTNRQDIQVWRIHNGRAEQLQELASDENPSDGTYKLDGTKGVFIYSKHLSMHAISSTASSTTQPTQASPAPVAGLIAGLGVAALVLRRMRR